MAEKKLERETCVIDREMFEKHRKFLEKYVDPNFGLLDKLMQKGALSRKNSEEIEAMDNKYKRNSLLLNFISTKGKHDSLIEALRDTNQSHIVNYLRGNGEHAPEFAGDWPLLKRERRILKANQEFLVDNIDMDELLDCLYATGVINKRQRQFISSKAACYEKNKAFVEILSRHSLRGYFQTIRCLQKSNQNHIAAVLDREGVVVRAVVNVEGEEGNINLISLEHEIVSKMDTLLDNLSQEEEDRVLNELLQLRFFKAATRHSVALYFHCLSLDEVKNLEKVAKNGELKRIVENVFSRLLATQKMVRVNLDSSYKDSCSRARNSLSVPLSRRLSWRRWHHFKDTTSIRGRTNANEAVFTPTSFEHLPTELLDVILQKCYLQFYVNSGKCYPNVYVITDLASVSYSWCERIISRRVKSKTWALCKVSCQRYWKRFTVCRNIHQYLVENIHTKGLLKQLRTTDCLTDKEMRQVNRFKDASREFNRNAELLHFIMLLDNARYSTFSNCLCNTHQNFSSTVLAHGRAVVKLYVKTNDEPGYTRSFNTQKVTNALKNFIDPSKDAPELQQLYDRLQSNGVEILDPKINRDVVLWIWCSENSSLEKLQKISESNDLRWDLERLLTTESSAVIAENVSSTKTQLFEDYAVIVGPYDGVRTWRNVMKINLHRPSEIYFLQEVPTSVHCEAAAAVRQSTVYIAGFGGNKNEIWKYDSKTGWGQCASLVKGRSRHSVAFVDEVLYICGGYGRADKSVLDSVEAYDSFSNTCSSVGKLVIACDSSASCAYKRSVYIFGGWAKDYNQLSDVQVYDTVQNTCYLMSKPMPRRDCLLRSVMWHTSVILLGRFNCFIYNFENETWQTKEQLTTHVDYFALALSSNRIYVIGGGTSETDDAGETTWRCRDDVRSISIVNIFENKPDEWKFHGKLPQPCLIFAMGVIGGIIADLNTTRDVLSETLQTQKEVQATKEYTEMIRLIKRINIDGSQLSKAIDLTQRPASLLPKRSTATFAILVGLDSGQDITKEVLKINLRSISETHFVEEVPTSVSREVAAAVCQNTVYVVGLGIYWDEIWKYESNSEWNKCASLIQRKRKHSVSFVDDVLYICGGFVDADDKVLDSVEAYDVVTNTCSAVGKLVFPCMSPGNCVSYKESLYIFGGWHKYQMFTQNVQVYDTIRNSCYMLSKKIPSASRLMRAALWREKIILLGHENCFIYDLASKIWQMRTKFKTDVHHFGLILSNDRIYIIGGGVLKTDAGEKYTWICRDDVRSVVIETIIEDKAVEWKVHAKLPKPCLVHALGICYETNEDDIISRNYRRALQRDLVGSKHSTGYMKAMTSGEDTENILIIGLNDGQNIMNDVLKIYLNSPTEMYYVEEVSTSMQKEAASAVYHNTVYVVGIGKYSDEIWKYESDSGWNECASLIQRRRRHSVAFVNEVLFICGGFVDIGKHVLNSVEAYNAVTNTCTSVGKLVYPCRSSGNCVSYKKSLYIFGGIDKDDKAISEVQVYDTLQNTCHLLPKPMPSADHLLRTTIWRESVILLGHKNCFLYDFMSETWQVRDQFKTNVDHFGLVLSNDRIFVIGGGIDETDAEGRHTWTCIDDVRSVAIEKVIENKPVEWKIHAKLPKPCLVQSFAIVN